jgi:hypothetical protein
VQHRRGPMIHGLQADPVCHAVQPKQQHAMPAAVGVQAFEQLSCGVCVCVCVCVCAGSC